MDTSLYQSVVRQHIFFFKLIINILKQYSVLFNYFNNTAFPSASPHPNNLSNIG